MPLRRYEIANEYSHAAPELYSQSGDGNVGKNAPDEAVATLQGVAMAGLVGIVRQLGDLAKFAGEVFSDLHEEVMATSARGHDLLLRVQNIEEAIPEIEKSLLSEPNQLRFAYIPGLEWHVGIGINQNLFNQGDLPRFVRNSYRDCRGPPRLFFLDKFDAGGAGTCLKRYTDPSFFKIQWANSEISKAEKEHLERKVKREKKKRNQRWSRKAQQATALSKINARIGSNSPELKNIMASSNVWNQNANSEERSKENLSADMECRIQDSFTEVQKGFDDDNDKKDSLPPSEPITDLKSQLLKPTSNQRQEREKPSDINSQVEYKLQTSTYSCNQDEGENPISDALENKVSHLGFSHKSEARVIEINKVVSQKVVDSKTDPDEVLDTADLINESNSELEIVDISASKDKKVSSGLGEEKHATMPPSIVENVSKPASLLLTPTATATTTKSKASFLVKDAGKEKERSNSLDESSDSEVEDIHCNRPIERKPAQSSIVATHKLDEKITSRRAKSHHHNTVGEASSVYETNKFQGKVSIPSSTSDSHLIKYAKIPMVSIASSNAPLVKQEMPPESQSPLLQTKEHLKDRKEFIQDEKTRQFNLEEKSEPIFKCLHNSQEIFIPVCEAGSNTNNADRNEDVDEDERESLNASNNNMHFLDSSSAIPSETGADIVSESPHPNHGISRHSSSGSVVESSASLPSRKSSESLMGSVPHESDRKEKLPEFPTHPTPFLNHPPPLSESFSSKDEKNKDSEGFLARLPFSPSRKLFQEAYHKNIVSESPHPNHGISRHSSSGSVVESSASLPSRKSSESLMGSVPHESDRKEKLPEFPTHPTPFLNHPPPLSESFSSKDEKNKDSEGFLARLPFSPSRKLFQEAYHKNIDPPRQESDHKETIPELPTPTRVLNDPPPLSESFSLKDKKNKDSEGFLARLPFPASRKVYQEACHKKIDPSRQDRKADRKPIKTYMPSFIPTRPSIHDFSDDSETSVKQHDTPMDNPNSLTEDASLDSRMPSPSLKQFQTPRNATVDSTKAPSKLNLADNIKPSESISSDISSPSNSPSPHIIDNMSSSRVPIPPALPDNTKEGYYQGHNPYVPAIGLMNRSESLIKAIASHDRSMLKKVSDISPPPKNPMDDARQQLLEQIRSQKFTLKQTVVKKRTTQLIAPSINVAAILEKANAIRQALEGFDEGSDSWSDS